MDRSDMIKPVRTKLIKARGERTQEYVAKQLGISQKYLSHLERGVRIPSLIIAWRIAGYYEKSLEELFPDILERSKI